MSKGASKGGAVGRGSTGINPNSSSKGNSNAPLEITQANQLVLPSKDEILKNDKLLRGMVNEDGVFDLLDVVLAEMAEEGASLKYERIKKEFNDEATDRISLRRANILKMIGDSLIQKRNLALNDLVNLRSPQWQVVFKQLMDRVQQTFVDLGYSSEQVELFFQKLQGNLEGFEEATEQKLKETIVQGD